MQNKILNRQLAADYCCSEAEVAGAEHVFTYYHPQDNRRKFNEQETCFLKIACVHGKLLVTGQKEIVDWCREHLNHADAAWVMEFQTLKRLDEILGTYGYRIGEAHPFYIATDSTPDIDETGPKWYLEEEIEQFRGDERFEEAFAFCETAPDRIGVSLSKKNKILGMAGASSDSPYMWQIGINVEPEARGTHIGSRLVACLKNRLLADGILPYYGTAMSHVASQNVAIGAGFFPAWTELYARKKGE